MNNGPRYFVLDADDRIVQVSEDYHESMACFLGHLLWEYLPKAQPVLQPHFESARSTGNTVESTIFYAGTTVDVRIAPAGNSLTVESAPQTKLNVRTLATLTESLQRIEAQLAGRASEQFDPPAPASLQALL